MFNENNLQNLRSNTNLPALNNDSNIPTTVYWPDDIKLQDKNEKYMVIAYRINKIKIVVIDIIKKEDYKDFNAKLEKDTLKKLEIVSCINFKSKKYSNKITEYHFEKNKPIIPTHHNLIYFKPPSAKRLEYYSIEPIKIDIFWTSNSQKTEHVYMKPSTEKYGSKMRQHWPNNQAFDDNDTKGEDMREILRIINLNHYIREKINPRSRNLNSIFSNFINYYLAKVWAYLTIVSFLYYFFVQKTCYLISKLLTFKFLRFNYKPTSNGSSKRYLIEVSLTSTSFLFHQINFRMKQLYNLPLQFGKLRVSKIESEASIIKDSKFSPSEYIKFYNTVWLIINDLLLGAVLSTLLRRNHYFIVESFRKGLDLYLNAFSHLIKWLMNSPAGFKLNDELATFMGQLILWVLEFWKNTTLKWLDYRIDYILVGIEIAISYGGASLFFSILLDIFNLIILNVSGFYVASTRLYCWQLSIVKSLFKLFYGKKYNVLRNRVDSNDYEFDQLMLGIIICTILIYLLPTVFIFYLTFMVARVGILAISLIMQMMLIVLNHFPAVVLLLKLKNEERLPAGINLELNFANDCLTINSKSLTLSEIFKSHINSMLNFNLFNLNNQSIDDFVESINSQGRVQNFKVKEYTISDVLEFWKNISFITLVWNFLLGETIKDYNYKQMF